MCLMVTDDGDVAFVSMFWMKGRPPCGRLAIFHAEAIAHFFCAPVKVMQEREGGHNDRRDDCLLCDDENR